MSEVNFGEAIVLPPCCFKKLIGDEFKGNNWNVLSPKTKDPQPKTRMFYHRGDVLMEKLIDYAVKRTGWASMLVISQPTLDESTVKRICGLMDMFDKERPLVVRAGIVTSESEGDVLKLIKEVSGKDYGQRLSVKRVRGLSVSAIVAKNAKALVSMQGAFVQKMTPGLYGLTVSTSPAVYQQITDYLHMALRWKKETR